MDSGFAVLVFLFVSAPLLDLSWMIIEIVRSGRLGRKKRNKTAFVMPLLALFFLVEAMVIDLYIVSFVRM